MARPKPAEQPVEDGLSAPDENDPAPVTAPAPAPVTAESLAQLVAATPKPAKLDPELRCLAGAVYFESRGESLPGQLAVAHVVINRANSGRFPKSLCGVVHQKSQFSFVRGGRMPATPLSIPSPVRASNSTVSAPVTPPRWHG